MGLNKRHRLYVTAILFGILFFCMASMAYADGGSITQKVALVPNATGLNPHGGTLPTSGFSPLPDGTAFNPVFTNLHPDNIKNDITDPLMSFDTMVWVQVGNIDSYLSDNTFKSRVENFLSNGGKLIIWDSECTATDYSKFIYPFQTSNPGAWGASNLPITFVEENTLSSSDPSSYYYIDTAKISSETDAVGDANVFTTYDTNWCVDMKAKNCLGTEGPVHCYARYGKGLILYCGLDMDYMGWSSSSGAKALEKIFELELKQTWNPDNLPCGVLAAPAGKAVGSGKFAPNNYFNFDVVQWPGQKAPNGSLTYSVPANKISVRSCTINSFAPDLNNLNASFSGTCTGNVNGKQAASFKVKVEDNSESGGKDRFTIEINDKNGVVIHNVSGDLLTGDIRILELE